MGRRRPTGRDSQSIPTLLLRARFGCRLGGRGGGLGDGRAKNREELHRVLQRRSTADDLVVVARDHDEGGRGRYVEAQAQIVISLDSGGEIAAGVHNEGHLLSVLLHPAARELLQIILVVDQALRGEDVTAELVGEFGADFVLQITRADGAVEGPDVLGQREVVAEKRNVVLLRRLDRDGVGAGAQGTAEILEYDDGYLAAGGRAQDRGVFEVVVNALADELDVSREGRESGQDNSGGDQRHSAHSR